MAREELSDEGQHRLVTEIAELFPRQKEWTEEDYFALPETNRLIELSERELIMPPHPTPYHQRIVGRLDKSFSSFVEARDLGIILTAPCPVRLWPCKIREPDIFVFLQQHADRIGEQFCGPPDLAVEVLSPSTRRTDLVEKFAEYAQAAVAEYWRVYPEEQIIEVFVLREGAYTLPVKAGRGGKVWSQLLEGFELDVDHVFAK